ncbi:lactoylglutathione lyase [Micromonospora echinaurantiaca]|uniref:Lactoylglutathione lyase n=1 Tax=Micromonospora echinaurantiaca TaxID=47857 RepID=A0A1C5JDT5_9ACTN|nr:VOC family protein [Micromonospora echinaurantiaca]SCG68379.1 lactoylglutathione lyase [Micromonospora echinaurantiaca]
MSKPLAEELFPILTAADLPAALGFYRDLLGGAVTYRFPETGEPEYVALSFGAGQLGIGRQAEPGPPPDDRIALWVYVRDCDAAVARLRAAGVTVLADPATQPWGERMAVVRDPDGHRVIVADRGWAGER